MSNSWGVWSVLDNLRGGGSSFDIMQEKREDKMDSIRNSSRREVDKKWKPGIVWACVVVAVVVVCLFSSHSQALAQVEAAPNCDVYNSGCGTDSHPPCSVVTALGIPFGCSGDESQTYPYLTCGAPVADGTGCSDGKDWCKCSKSRTCTKKFYPDLASWYCAWGDWVEGKASGCFSE